MNGLGIRLGLACLLVGYVQAQNNSCDFYQETVPGRTYYITSPGYAANYTPGVQCRWILNCTANYNCRLDCPEINLPVSPQCMMDRFLVSRTGDSQLVSAEYYCGQGSLSNVVSTGQIISLGLKTTNINSSRGGRFYCQVTPQRATTSPATCNCGFKRGNRIVNGQPTGVNEFPMMAAVVYEKMGIKCGATIISEQYVVTAAHCVDGRAAATIGVVVGEHDISTGNDTAATQGFRIEGYVIHPQYTSANYDYDIAVIKIQGTMQFSDRVGPVCLPFKFVGTSFAGANATLLGWGTQYIGGPKSNVLQMVTVNVTTQAECQAKYPDLTPRQMCTYTPGKDACQDDSGGPALYTDRSNGRLYNIGVISYGRFCASNGFPGINSRVTTLLDWIVRVAPADYCNV